MRVAAPSHPAGTDAWRISTIGRPFIRPNFVFDNIRNYQSPLEAFALEFALLPIGFCGPQYLQGAIIEGACELAENMYLARPQKIDIRSIRDTPWRSEAKPIIHF